MQIFPDEIETVVAALRAHRHRSKLHMRKIARRIRNWTDENEAIRPGYRAYLQQAEQNQRYLQRRIDRIIQRSERDAA